MTANNKSFISIPTGREILKKISEGLVNKSSVKWYSNNGIHTDSPLFFPYYLDDPICKSSDIVDLGHPYYDFCWCKFKDSHSANYFLLFEDGDPVSIVYLDVYFGVQIIHYEDIILIICKKGHVVAINLSTLKPIFIGPISQNPQFQNWIWNLGDVRIDGEYQVHCSGDFKNNSLFIRESTTGKTVEYFLDIRDYEVDFVSEPDRFFTFDSSEWDTIKSNNTERIF